MSIFKKKINEFPTPYTCKNAVKKGGVETKLSMILMGFGNIVHGQIIKGLLYLAVEIAYIVFMAVNGIGFIGGLRTLGTVQQQEVWDEAKQIYIYNSRSRASSASSSRFLRTRSFSATFAERPTIALIKSFSYSLAKQASRCTS